MVDTRDLKSLGQQWLCGFDSRPRHENTLSGYLEGVFLFIWQTFGKQLIAWSLLPMPLNRRSEIWMILDFTCYC